MKKMFAITIALTALVSVHAQNPFEGFGYNGKILTMTNGKYNEFHDLDSVVQIGSIMLDVHKKIIVGYAEVDTTIYMPSPTLISRWWSPDPYASTYHSTSPYAFVENNPVNFIDVDGGFKIGVHRKITQDALKSVQHGGVGSLLFGNTLYADIVGAGSDFHFDRRDFAGISQTFSDIKKELGGVTNANSIRLGRMLHSIQDFYSHSNYVELFSDYFQKKYGTTPSSTEIPTFEEAASLPIYDDFYNNYLKENLETGDFHFGWWLLGVDKKKSDKKGKIHHDDLNKDSPSHNLHNLAKAVATRNTTQVLGDFFLIIGSQGGSGTSSSSSSSYTNFKKPKKHKFVQDW
jgi:hypothetical protein